MAVPELVSVDSTSIAAIGYDGSTHELYVKFTASGTYVYTDVPEITHQELMNADSKGGYVNRKVKPRYDYRRV